MSQEFTGPVFVVGMPRSGTKLLRDLLNQHSRIGIPAIESNMLPYFHRRAAEYGDLRVRENFRRFHADWADTYFVRRLEPLGVRIGEDAWYGAVREWTFAGVVEAYFRLAAAGMGKDVWGDKSPPYMLHLPMLATLYPEARFVHIIRDVRDYCLSIRNAWGKHMLRAAQRWADDVTQCLDDVERLGLGGRFLQVRYEDLIQDPAGVLARICAFLDLPYEPAMATLRRPSENLGAAKGEVRVVADNAGKWATGLRPAQVARIESIAGAALARAGYPVTAPRAAARLGRAEMLAAKLSDGANLFRSYRREHGGSLPALRFMYHTYLQRASRH